MSKKVFNTTGKNIKILNIVLKPHQATMITNNELSDVIIRKLEYYKRIGHIKIFDYEELKIETLPVSQEATIKTELSEVDVEQVSEEPTIKEQPKQNRKRNNKNKKQQKEEE